MGKIIVTTNASLDGVVQDPDGLEGFTRGGWFRQFGGKDLDGWTRVETTRRSAPRPCCWGVPVTSGSQRGGSTGPASGLTG
jgi:hypothetical protein